MKEFEFFSRYEALGIPLPDSETMCEGDCEGVGLVPQSLMRKVPIELCGLKQRLKNLRKMVGTL